MYRRGFTIVELIIVITIMGILLVLGVVNLRGSQMNARDTERKGDVESIALNMESFYTSGTDGSTIFGRYPSTTIIGNETTYLRDVDPKTLASPGLSSPSLVPATCITTCVQTTAGVTPQPTEATYVYQPVKSDGSLCATELEECRKFNIYYKLEVASSNTAQCPSPGFVCIVTSKNQ